MARGSRRPVASRSGRSLWRSLAAVLALASWFALAAHEGEHFVHGDEVDACEFAFITGGIAPPPPPLLVAPMPRCALAQPVRDASVAGDSFDHPQSARGPPAPARA
jgi:hypothetical protein